MTRPRTIPLALVMVFLSGFTFGQRPSVDFQLDNGLQVQLKPLTQGKNCALVVLYSVGNLHDPPGKSGLSHMAEHMYVTAATSATKMRTVNEYARNYPNGFNAQTGDDYTVLATVFSLDQLKDEINEAAQRMTSVRVTAEDLARELPRLDLELNNMFGGLPHLAAPNLGQQALAPLNHAGRRGGVIEQLKTVKLAEVQDHLDSFYKPRNARLVLVGPFDVEETEKLIRQSFGKIDAGKKLPLLQHPPLVQNTRSVPQSFTRNQLANSAMVSLTYEAPLPKDERYPAFLFAVTRMRQAAMSRLKTKPGEFPIAFAPIDKPRFLSITLRVPKQSTVAETQKRIEQFINEQIEQEIGDGESARVILWNNGLLFLRPVPDVMLARNPYTFAFSQARTTQLGLNKTELVNRVEAMTTEGFKKACQSIFDPNKRSVVVMVPKNESRKQSQPK